MDTLFSERDDEMMASLPISAVHLWSKNTTHGMDTRGGRGHGRDTQSNSDLSHTLVSQLLSSLVWARGPVRMIVSGAANAQGYGLAQTAQGPGLVDDSTNNNDNSNSNDGYTSYQEGITTTTYHHEGSLRSQVGLVNDETNRSRTHGHQRSPGVRVNDIVKSDDHDMLAMSWRVLLAACCDKDATGLAIPLNIQDLQVSEPLVAVAELRYVKTAVPIYQSTNPTLTLTHLPTYQSIYLCSICALCVLNVCPM